MPTSRAGLKSNLSPRWSMHPRSTTTILGALLLFIISLSTSTVQAAPFSTHSITSVASFSVSEGIFHCAGGSHGFGVWIPPDGAYNTAQLKFMPNSLYAASSRPHTPINTQLNLPELTSRDEPETILLVRRKSIAAKIRDAFHHLGHKIKHAFQKVGQAIKHAAQKVGHFLKTTGAKIAKVALKIAATVGKIAAKVVGFIPGVGKVVGKAMEGASEGLNKASDAIHAHIGGKLGKAMTRMDKAQKVVGYIP